MAIGKQIKLYRGRLGWKLKELSELSGVEVGTISALEIRDSKKSDFFLPLAAAMGLTLEQLADESTEYTPNPPSQAPQPAPLPVASTGGAVVAMERTPFYPSQQNLTDPQVNEAIRIMVALSEADRRGALANLRTYVQNLSPPQDGQALQVAGG